MNFTKQYIKECDCKSIQGLREVFELGDRIKYFNESQILEARNLLQFNYPVARKGAIWLPTGDQLDDEIVKICKDKIPPYNCDVYNFQYIPYLTRFRAYVSLYILDDENDMVEKAMPEIFDVNPLLAKIKLLKQLLKEEQ